MNSHNLRKSIYIIKLLVLLIVLQHIILIIEPDQMGFSIITNLATGTIFIFFLIQLQRNFKFYLKIENIKSQIIVLGISYSVLVILAQIIKLIKDLNPNHNLHNTPMPLLIILTILSFSSVIITIIQYVRLGNKLSKNTSMVEIKQLAYSLYLIPVLFLIIMIFEIFKAIKPFEHIFIILELLPYWFTYKIYKQILKSKNEDNAFSEETVVFD